MENTNFNIEVKEAFLVTKDAITNVQAFTMKKVNSSYGGSIDETYYLTEKGWKQANSWSWGGEKITYTQEDGNDAKREMMAAHLQYLKQEKERNEKLIADMEIELAK